MIRIVLSFFLVVVVANTSAQTLDTIVDGKPFKIHEVQPRQTLFGISRLYNVELNQLVIHNPVVIEGLYIGYPLLIPVTNLKDETTVKDSLLLPTSDSNIMQVDKFVNDSVLTYNYLQHDSTVKIALLLPFYLDLNDSLNSKGEGMIHPKSKVAIDYFSGFQLAIDTLTDLGLSIDVMLFDVLTDSVLQSILNQNLLFDRNIIFGPLYIRQFEQLAKYYGYDKKKTLISPLSHKSVQGNYLNVVQANPIAEVQIDSLINHLLSTFTSDKIVVFGHSGEEHLIQHAKKKLKHQILSDRCNAVTLDEENISNRQFLKNHLDVNSNIILIPSNNRAFVSRILPILASMQDTSITVYGLETWNKFDNLDFDDLEKLNVHLPKYTPKSAANLKAKFTENYMQKFRSYPSKYALSAFWHALYFLTNEFSYLFDFKNYQPYSFRSCTTFDITQFSEYQQVKY